MTQVNANAYYPMTSFLIDAMKKRGVVFPKIEVHGQNDHADDSDIIWLEYTPQSETCLGEALFIEDQINGVSSIWCNSMNLFGGTVLHWQVDCFESESSLHDVIKFIVEKYKLLTEQLATTEAQFCENQIIALNGKQFAMLDDRERECLKIYRQQGRKYGIQISFSNNACADELNAARSNEQADEILKRAGSTITVTKVVN